MENKDIINKYTKRIWRHCLESQRESESILSYKESMEDSGNQQKHNYDSWS